jgi:hypothetical protein
MALDRPVEGGVPLCDGSGTVQQSSPPPINAADPSLHTPIQQSSPPPVNAADPACILQSALTWPCAGWEATPFLLSRVNELTGGESLKSNVALIKNNAVVGARIAVELSHLRRGGGNGGGAAPTARGLGSAQRRHFSSLASSRVAAAEAAAGISGAGARCRRRRPGSVTAVRTASTSTPTTAASASPFTLRATPVVVGGAVVDLLLRPLPGRELVLHTSNPGTASLSFGGVGRNVSEVCARLGAPPVLVTAIGPDSTGQALRRHAEAAGVRVVPVGTAAASTSTAAGAGASGRRTATYTALLAAAVEHRGVRGGGGHVVL